SSVNGLIESKVCSRSQGHPPGARNLAMMATARSKRSPVLGGIGKQSKRRGANAAMCGRTLEFRRKALPGTSTMVGRDAFGAPLTEDRKTFIRRSKIVCVTVCLTVF